jgi:hypothetical protein
VNPYTAMFLWLGVWNLEAATFWTDLAERIDTLSE